MTNAPVSYAFGDQKDDGRYPVLDATGRRAASFIRGGFSRRFEARDADDRAMCSGRARRLLRCYVVVDAAGRPLLTARTSPFTASRRTVRLADGTRYRLRGERRSRSWTVAGPDGNPALTITPAGSRLRVRNAVVRVEDPRLSLPLVVALVLAHQQDADATRLVDLFF